MTSMTVVMAQINPRVGDVPGNVAQVIAAVRQAEKVHAADLVVFPELTLMGYPPEDLLLRDSVASRVAAGLQQIMAADLKATLVVGYPRVTDGLVYNAAGVIADGQLIAETAKQCLPNYQVFDDKRYFAPGAQTLVVPLNGVPTAILICEDVWEPGPSQTAREQGAELILALNASPFEVNKQYTRRQVLAQRVAEVGLPIIYVNQVGGQDELVFDGGSLAINHAGEPRVQAPHFTEGLYPVTVRQTDTGLLLNGELCEPLPEELPRIYQALVLGVRDYVEKNGFPGVLLGLSGGIDSALTLAIATDALGAERVHAVMMPYHYTAQISEDDAAEEARRLGVDYQAISIAPMVEAFMAQLADEFAGLPVDTTEQNLQARCRGTLLMAISNKKGYLVLTTGNKSEVAVGYSTLYGDMAGGFDVLKDVSKTRVFALSRYRNSLGEVIPARVISRPPSAELAPDQKDEDSLPPYDVLDQILALYIEEDQSGEAIIAQGYERVDVERVLRLVDLNEYKRRQAPIGPRITKRGFGRDRRYPITSGWKIGD